MNLNEHGVPLPEVGDMVHLRDPQTRYCVAALVVLVVDGDPDGNCYVEAHPAPGLGLNLLSKKDRIIYSSHEQAAEVREPADLWHEKMRGCSNR